MTVKETLMVKGSRCDNAAITCEIHEEHKKKTEWAKTWKWTFSRPISIVLKKVFEEIKSFSETIEEQSAMILTYTSRFSELVPFSKNW